MRFAIVTETYPPEVNGVALTVQGLEQGLRSRGHAVELVRPRRHAEQALGHELLVRGAALPRYPGLRFGLPAPLTLARQWQRQRPDAVYIATEGPLGWSALRCAQRLGIPVATGLHTRFDEYLPDYGAARLQPAALAWMRRFHNRGQATLVPTRELQQFLQHKGFARARLLARAVDTGQFAPRWRDPHLRRQWDIGDDGLAVIHVGRIAAEKNLELAVRAFRRLQQLRPTARFIWVGDGPLRGKLARDNPDFLFSGIQRGEALARHFASGDLFLFPSRSETFGNVTLEAMASGVATVAFNYGAAREHLRSGRSGAAVDSDAAFISAALQLAADNELRALLGANACRAVQHLQPAQVVLEFEALLQTLASRTGEHDDAAA